MADHSSASKVAISLERLNMSRPSARDVQIKKRPHFTSTGHNWHMKSIQAVDERNSRPSSFPHICPPHRLQLALPTILPPVQRGIYSHSIFIVTGYASLPQYVSSIHRLSQVVPPERQILKDISLSFCPRAKIGVASLNGAGKSPPLRIMAGADTAFDGEARPMPAINV